MEFVSCISHLPSSVSTFRVEHVDLFFRMSILFGITSCRRSCVLFSRVTLLLLAQYVACLREIETLQETRKVTTLLEEDITPDLRKFVGEKRKRKGREKRERERERERERMSCLSRDNLLCNRSQVDV